MYNETLAPLTSAMLVLTHRCCMHCHYCFVKQENLDMTYETALKSVHFLIENSKINGSIPNITFFGGEPLLLWDEIIKPLVTCVRKELKVPFKFSITTNGILLNDEKLKFMKDNQVGLLFSIDGDKKTQSYNRPLFNGDNSFEVLKDNIDKIIKYFPNTTFRSTIIQPTCRYTWKNIKFAIDHKYKSLFTTPNIFEDWTKENKDILKEQIHKYSEYFVDCYREGITPIKFTSLEETMKRILDINAANKFNEYRQRPFCLACGKCGLGSNKYCAISPDGNIYACQELTSNEGEDSIFYIGSLYKGVDNDRRLQLIKSYNPNEARAKNLDCSVCKYNRICDGGCVANNYMINGNIHINPDMYCWWRKLLLEESEWIINVLGSEKNLRFKNYWMAINNERYK